MEVEHQNHVVVVARMGKHQGVKIYLTVPLTKRMATYDCEQAYRDENKLEKNVALLSVVVFSGTEETARAAMLTLDQKILEIKERDAKNTEGPQQHTEGQASTSTAAGSSSVSLEPND